MTSDPFHLLLDALAVYRLSLMVSSEDGPAWIFRKLRRAVPERSSAKKGISCQLCVSVWASILVMAFEAGHDSLPDWLSTAGDWLITMLAVSAVAVALHMSFTKGI